MSDINPELKYNAAKEDPYRLKKKVVRGGSVSYTHLEIPFNHRIYAYDIDANAVEATKANVIAAQLDEDFIVDRRDFREFKQPAEKAIMVINPPYGVRIKSDSALPLLLSLIHI